MRPGAELLPEDRPLPLEEIKLPGDQHLVVLAPHPDDFDAICVTLRFFQWRGCQIDLGVVTSGASGVEDAFSGTADAAVKARLREEEQRASCRFFGLPESRLAFLRLAEDEAGHPLENTQNSARVRGYLLDRRPGFVFLPHPNDLNPGHQRTYAIFRRIALEEGLSLAAFLNRDPKTIQMRPDVYTAFGEEESAWKAELLRFHHSQQERNLRTRGYGFDERILRDNRQVAEGLAGLTRKPPYAEVFELEFYGDWVFQGDAQGKRF